MKRSLKILILTVICLSLGAGAVLAQGRGGRGPSPGGSGRYLERPHGPSAERQRSSGQSSAGREKLSKEEREALREDEEPGAMGRMRRFFGWDRSQERMSEQGREHQRATEQQRGPRDREDD